MPCPDPEPGAPLYRTAKCEPSVVFSIVVAPEAPDCGPADEAVKHVVVEARHEIALTLCTKEPGMVDDQVAPPFDV